MRVVELVIFVLEALVGEAGDGGACEVVRVVGED